MMSGAREAPCYVPGVQCLGDETIAAYVDGALELDAVAQIDRHIDGCPTCRTQMSAVAATVMHSFVTEGGGEGEGTAATAKVFAAIERGQVGDSLVDHAIGRYRVESVIGRGGMGVVVRAHDPELDRAIAIKLVDPWTKREQLDASWGAWRARLRTEARAMARLRHPNVVTVYDVGTLGNQLFVAMELVDGESLARHLEHDRSDALALCLAAGRGLCAAHAAGLVHGDVKPDNILVDRDGRALVGDFGLTRAIADPGESGALIGTPVYMPPEQLRRQPADQHSDQFAFAVTVYEAVTGGRPWRATSLDALLRAIVETPPARPPEMTRAVWRVVARGLSPERVDRYPSLANLVDDLERAVRPRRTWIVAGAVAGAAALAAAAYGGRSHDTRATCAEPTDRTRTLAVSCGQAPSESCAAFSKALSSRAAAWRQTYVGVCRATRDGGQSAELLDRRMHCLDQRLFEHAALVDHLASRGASPIAGIDALDALSALHHLDAPETCSTFDRPGGSVPPARAKEIAEGERWVAGARADYALGHYAPGRDALAAHLDAIRSLGYAPLLASATMTLGELQMQSGDLQGAEMSFDAGLRAAAEAGDDVATATLLLDRAYLIGESRQQWERGAELLRAAETAIVRAGKPAQLEGNLLVERGLMAEDTGDFAAARTAYEQALEVRRASGDRSDVAVALQRLCSVEGQLGKLADARAHCEEAVKVLREELGEAHPHVAEAQSNLGIELAIEGDLKAAREHWLAALSTLERGLGPDAPGLAPVLLNLSDVSRELRDPDAAERYLARTVKVSASAETSAESIGVQIRAADQLRSTGKSAEGLAMLEQLARRAEATLGPAHPTTASALDSLGDAYYESDRYADARDTYQKAIKAKGTLYGERHPTTLGTMGRYGQALLEMNDAKAACPVFEQVMLATEETVKTNPPLLAQGYVNFADCLNTTGDHARALPLAEKALAILEPRADDPVHISQARFVLAQALWGARRDPQALVIARKARDEMRAIGPQATSLPDVERWLVKPP
jgi:tetratricopeptide (TPR) repeat protein